MTDNSVFNPQISKGRQIGSVVIDLILIGLIVGAVFYFFFGFDTVLQARMHNPGDVNARVAFLQSRNKIRYVALLLWFIYVMVMDSPKINGTIGKRILRVPLTDALGNRTGLRHLVMTKIAAYKAKQ